MAVEDGKSNPCCTLLAEKLKISTEKRNALRQGVKLLKQGAEALQKQVDALQTENFDLKKELEEQRELAASVREEKMRESSVKCNLETEVNALKSELQLLQHKVSEQDRGTNRDVHDEESELEIKKLKAFLEQENLKIDLERKEVNRLKVLLDTRAKSGEKKLMEERRNADESRRLAKSEKNKAEEERIRADNESKKAEEYRIQLQHSEEEAEQVRKMLALESSKAEKACKKLESEKKKGITMKKQADSMIENLNKETHAAREKALEEESRAVTFLRLLEEQKLKIEELQSDRDKYLSVLRAPDTGTNGSVPESAKGDSSLVILGVDNNQKAETIKKRCTMDMENSHDARQISNKLKQQGVDNLQDIPKLEHNLKSSRGPPLYDGRAKTKVTSEEVKLLKKQLRFERERVTHAFEVAKLEKARCGLLHKELYLLKQDFLHLSHRMNSLDSFMSSCTEGIDDLVQKNSEGTALLDAKEGYVESVSGINSDLDPLKGGCPRKMLQSSAINSTVVSFSDKKLMGSQETNMFSVSPSDHFAMGIEKLHTGISNRKAFNVNFSANSGTVADNSDRSAPNTESVNQMNSRGRKRKRITSAIESLGYLHSESKKLHLQMEEKLGSLNCMITAKKNSDDLRSGLENNPGEKSITRCQNEAYPSAKLHERHAERENQRHNLKMFCQNKEMTVQEMIAEDYLKVLELDDPFEEEQYQMAIQSPMSPSIPDVTLSSLENASHLEIPFIFPNTESVIKPLSFVVFSDIGKKSVISRIVHATRSCFAQCSLPSRNTWALQEIIYALITENNLSPKEMACALFSLLLWHVSAASAISSGNFFVEEFRICCHSFSLHVSKVMDNANVRSVFAKVFNSDELLSLIEEFLIYRVVLVGDGTHSYSVIEVLVDSRTRLFKRTATTDELVASGVILASLCSRLGRVAVLHEISCSILQINGFDRRSLLIIVHVFARICGNAYLNPTVSVTVMKSVVAFIEREESVSFPQCTDCPFSRDTISLDGVIGSLLEKLRKLSSRDIDRHLIEKFSSSNEPECTGNDETALGVKLDSLRADDETALEVNCGSSDVLQLVEMLAFAIPWKCTCQKVVPGLLKITASCDSMKVSAVVITLLGQIGRFGADVAGFDDAGVLRIKSVLLSYMSSFATHKKEWDFVVQIALVRALLGVVPVEFSEIIADDLQQLFRVNICSNGSVHVVRTWLSSLSGKEKILCERLFMQEIK